MTWGNPTENKQFAFDDLPESADGFDLPSFDLDETLGLEAFDPMNDKGPQF